MQKYAFLDRDGTLIFEPQDTFRIDSIEVLKILPNVIPMLKKLMNDGFRLILVSNQDGIGRPEFPKEAFQVPHDEFLRQLTAEGISFDEIFICPHLPEDTCNCRKPKTGLVDEFLKANDVDYAHSFMCGDRLTDGEFAKNIGMQFVKTETNGPLTLSNL